MCDKKIISDDRGFSLKDEGCNFPGGPGDGYHWQPGAEDEQGNVKDWRCMACGAEWYAGHIPAPCDHCGWGKKEDK